MRLRIPAYCFALSTVCMPELAYAQTVSVVVGVFNIVVGLMLVAALLLFFGGFIFYLVRLGTEPREEGLKIMQWGVVILFVLVVVLAIVQLIQHIFG